MSSIITLLEANYVDGNKNYYDRNQIILISINKHNEGTTQQVFWQYYSKICVEKQQETSAQS